MSAQTTVAKADLKRLNGQRLQLQPTTWPDVDASKQLTLSHDDCPIQRGVDAGSWEIGHDGVDFREVVDGVIHLGVKDLGLETELESRSEC